MKAQSKNLSFSVFIIVGDVPRTGWHCPGAQLNEPGLGSSGAEALNKPCLRKKNIKSEAEKLIGENITRQRSIGKKAMMTRRVDENEMEEKAVNIHFGRDFRPKYRRS